jgi:hypothetical protein
MKALAVLSSLVVAFTAHASTNVFTDNTFDLANYSTTPSFTTSPSDTIAFAQCPTCGNPGQALQIQMTLPTAFDLATIGFVNNTFAYNPLSQGPITSIDASVDKDIITNLPLDPNPVFTNTFRPLIKQDGKFYLAAISGPNFNGGTTGFNTISGSGLLATDFTQFGFSTGTFDTGHPSFAGDPMLFGLGQITSIAVDNVNFEADYDNLRLAIHTPDSGTTFLFLLGSTVPLLGLRLISIGRRIRS